MASPFTDRWFAALEDFRRTVDDTTGGQLLAFLDALGQLVDPATTLAARADYLTPDEGGAAGDTSDLVDPATADAGWLPYLAQVVYAVPLDGVTDSDERRRVILARAPGRIVGTKADVLAAAKGALTGTRTARVLDHSDPTGAAGEWDVLVMTRPEETPSQQAVIDAVIAAGAKPAGVHLWVRDFAPTVGEVDAAYPTAADWSGLTVADVQATGLPA